MATLIPGSVDENARRQFEAAWQQGRPEPIEHFLPPENHSRYLATLKELVHIDLEFSRKAIQRTSAGTSQTRLRPALVD